MCNCDPKQNCTCGTEQPLVAAIEENWSESYAAYAGAPQVELDASPEFISVITGIPSPWYNGVFQSRLDTGELERQIDGIIAQYKKRGIPLSWWSGCSSGPDNLHNALEAHGLKQVVELPEMA